MLRSIVTLLSLAMLVLAARAEAQCLDAALRKPDCDQQKCISLIDREHIACEARERCNDASLTREELSKRLAQNQKCVQYNTDAQACFKKAESHPSSQVAAIKDFVKECEAAINKKK